MIEKIVFIQFSNFLADQILDTRHSGYRSGYSPQTALLAITEDAREALGEIMITFCFVDFST